VEYKTVARVGDVGEGEVVCVELDGTPISLANAGGEIYAFAAFCSHQRALLEEGDLEGTTIQCPWHAGSFDITNGRALTAPAFEDIQTYPVRLSGEEIQVATSAVANV
jgi:3-phenylpropionate/trans-cinnamate dioxygenase ferredoxin component